MIHAFERHAVQSWANSDPHGYHDATAQLWDLAKVERDLPDALAELAALQARIRCMTEAARTESERARTRISAGDTNPRERRRYEQAERILAFVRKVVRP